MFREYVTVHAGTAQDRGDTAIGNGNLFLAYTHVAHDCVVGNHTTFSNNAQIAGHVHIGDWAVLGAFAGVHQFCRVGAHAMVAAFAVVLQDVPPYVTVQGYPAKPHGTNNEGLRRRGFTAEDISADPPRVQDALPRGPRARRRARENRGRARRSAPVLAPLAAFLARAAAAASCASGVRDAHARRAAATPVTVGIVAGEASGDALAATLIHAVRARLPGVRFAGIAGPQMEAAGCEAWFPLEKLAVRGFVEVIAHLPELFASAASCARGFSLRACRCSSASTRPTSISGSSAS